MTNFGILLDQYRKAIKVKKLESLSEIRSRNKLIEGKKYADYEITQEAVPNKDGGVDIKTDLWKKVDSEHVVVQFEVGSKLVGESGHETRKSAKVDEVMDIFGE